MLRTLVLTVSILAALAAVAAPAATLEVNSTAALDGSSGLEVSFTGPADTSPAYLQDDRPAGETTYRASFLFDPNSISMVDGERHKIFQALQEAPQVRLVTVVFRKQGGAMRVLFKSKIDDGSFGCNSGFLTISDAPHWIEFVWTKSSAPGANDGRLDYYLDFGLEGTCTNLDNDAIGAIDRVRLGAVGGVKPGTLGSQYFDQFIAQGQNVLANAELPTDQLVAGWSVYLYGEALDWTGVDADGCPNSGAGQLETELTDVGTQVGYVGQCHFVDSASWPTGAHAAFSYHSPDADAVYLSLDYHSSGDCGVSGGDSVGIHSAQGAVGPGWHRVEIDDLAIPPTALSVFVSVGVEAFQTTPIEIWFDRAYFGRYPALFSDDFEPGSTCRWSSVVD